MYQELIKLCTEFLSRTGVTSPSSAHGLLSVTKMSPCEFIEKADVRTMLNLPNIFEILFSIPARL